MLRLAFHFFHHRQSAECPSTDDELAAFPRYVLRDGKWRVSKVVAEFLGRLFLAVADLPAVDDHIVLVGVVVEAEGAQGEISEAHPGPLRREARLTNFIPPAGQLKPRRQRGRIV